MRLQDLLDFDDIVVQCHDFPDADTIASGFGVYCYLLSNGKVPSLLYSGGKVITKPNLLLMIEKLNIPIRYEKTLDRRPQLLITVDCVAGESNVSCFDAENYAAIDHHFSANVRSELYEIRRYYGSCSSVVAAMLTEAGFRFNDNTDLATALYYGLYTDTNGLSEVSHPADRDLRDFSDYKKDVIALLTNSNLSLLELRMAGETLRNVKHGGRHRFAVASVKEECDPNILGFINDLILQVDTVDVSVVCCRASGGLKISVRSCVGDTVAAELAEYITENIGSGGGNRTKAGGFIKISPDFASDSYIPLSFLEGKLDSYYKCFDIINSEDFVPVLVEMPVYVKKSKPFGYAVSTSISPAGTAFRIKSAESDFDIEADDDVYIMINGDGAVYTINKEKFTRRYEPSSEKFRLENSDAVPIVISRRSGKRELMPYISCCTSVSATKLHAMELSRRTKLYHSKDSDSYIAGRAGDYIVLRTDSNGDMTIIERDQFKGAYELLEE